MTLKTVTSLAEAEHFLFEALPKSPKTLFKHGKGIERSKIFFNLIDNPQNKLRTIHIAATSGKGSTSHILDALLLAHGKTTGTHVSPHVYDYRERMMVNGQLISEQELVDALNSLFPAIEQMDASPAGRPTYFEVSNALAFNIFVNNKVDYAIIETGLGGLNDSTNTNDRSDKLALLGQIGEDHVEILGGLNELIDAANQDLVPDSFTKLPTVIERIAAQKAGIMPFGGEVLALKQLPAVNAVFEEMARFRKTKLTYVTANDFDFGDAPFSLPGKFQRDNLALAYAAMQKLSTADGWQIKEELVRKAMAGITLPGRFEIRQLRRKMLILDGSHNPQKMAALVEAFSDRFPAKQATVIMAIGDIKDVPATLCALSPITQTIICTDFFNDRQDFRSSSMKPTKLAELAAAHTSAKVITASSQQDAVNQALASDSDIILITGSFYFLGEINTLLV